MDVICNPPITFVKTIYISRYRYFLEDFILNQEVTIKIECFDNEHRMIHQIRRKLIGGEYNAWGNDDSYIQNIILEEINGTKGVIPLVSVLPVNDVYVLPVNDVSVLPVNNVSVLPVNDNV